MPGISCFSYNAGRVKLSAHLVTAKNLGTYCPEFTIGCPGGVWRRPGSLLDILLPMGLRVSNTSGWIHAHRSRRRGRDRPHQRRSRGSDRSAIRALRPKHGALAVEKGEKTQGGHVARTHTTNTLGGQSYRPLRVQSPCRLRRDYKKTKLTFCVPLAIVDVDPTELA